MSLSPESFSPEWIAAIANVFIAFGVVFIAWQAFSAAWQAEYTSKQIAADHERGRRLKAIELMEFWCTQRLELLPAMLIKDVIEELEYKECEKLFQLKEFSINICHKPVIEDFLSVIQGTHSEEIKQEKEKILLKEYQIKMIRIHISMYLNTLEVVATAWRHNVADRDIIAEEFKDLFVKGKGKNIVRFEQYMKASGVYPSITRLANAIKDKENSYIQKSQIA